MQLATQNKNFIYLINKVIQNGLHSKAIIKACQAFDLRQHKIQELQTETVIQIYTNLIQKIYEDKKVQFSTPWFENQRRIFLWLIFVYLHSEKMDIEQMSSEDWEFFEKIFYKRDPLVLRYQMKLLVRKSDKSYRHQKWDQQENKILGNIVSSMKERFRWNDVAKGLFKESKQVYFRNPKQCREQWKNHLDPQKSHCKWSTSEDQILLEQVINKGKKWASIVECLKGRRTQHMIKNRYNTLIKTWKKQFPNTSEKQLLRNHLQNLDFNNNFASINEKHSSQKLEKTCSDYGQVSLQNTDSTSQKPKLIELLPSLILNQDQQPNYGEQQMMMWKDNFIPSGQTQELTNNFFTDIETILNFGFVPDNIN